MTEQRADRRRPPQRLLVSVLTGASSLALLGALGVVVSFGLAPASLPVNGATRYVAPDGTRGFGTFSEAGQQAPAMVENAVLTGSQIVSGVPGGMFARSVAPPGVGLDQAHWLRESGVVSGVDRPESRYRLRSLTADGVALHGQSWGRLGMTFEPALLELPASVTTGSRWDESGQAVGYPDDRLLTYRRTSEAQRPSTPEDAAAGCLQVVSDTALQPADGPAVTDASSRWSETQLWCPGRGVVADRGDFRGTAFEITAREATAPSTLRAAALDPAVPSRVPSGGDLADWRHGLLAADDGDSTFGSHPTSVDTDASTVAAAAAGTLHVRNSTERDVNILIPLTNGRFQAVGWMHPGAQVTSLTSVGNVVVLTTADRRLMAYDFAGRLRWSTTLPEVAVTTPISVPGDRLLVATLGGQVGSYDLLTGTRIWRHDVGAAVVAGLASGAGVGLVVDADSQLHALDLSDGRERWNSTVATARTEVVVIGDRVVTHDYAHLTGLDVQTGRIVWEHTGLGDTLTVRSFGDLVVLLRSGDVTAFAADDGALRWRRPGAVLDARRYGDADFLLERDALVAVDTGGRERRRWSVGVDLGRAPRLLTGTGVLWAVGADSDGLTGMWVGDREPGG